MRKDPSLHGEVDPSEEASLLLNNKEGVGETGFGEFGVVEMGDGAGEYEVVLLVCFGEEVGE